MSCFSCCGIEPATTANDYIEKNSINVSIEKSSKDYTNNGRIFASIIPNLSIKSSNGNFIVFDLITVLLPPFMFFLMHLLHSKKKIDSFNMFVSIQFLDVIDCRHC